MMTTSAAIPNVGKLVSLILDAKAATLPIVPSAAALTPNALPSWPIAMTSAMPEVNPVTTGLGMN